MRKKRVLILGGTEEAYALANAVRDMHGLQAVTSLAGRTSDPREPAGEVRRGGFGGRRGLEDYLKSEKVDLVVDATHPFATAMSRHAHAACENLRVPKLHVERPPWEEKAGDAWVRVSDMTRAADALADHPGVSFLTIGRQELGAFRRWPGRTFLVRLAETPGEPLPLPEANVILTIGKGPETVSGEALLMTRHAVASLVTRNSGAESGRPKLEAARQLGIPVIMVERPPPPGGPRAPDVAGAVRWLKKQR